MRSGARLAARAGLFGCAVVLVALVDGLSATPAGAATAGTAVVVRPGTTTPLGGGASTTPYGVAIPAGASCPGDTAHDGNHVYTYLVPAGHLPTEVSYKTELPSRWYGFISEGAYVGALNTAVSTGEIVGLPTSYSWTRLTPQELFPDGQSAATWEGGIACVDTHGAVTAYWNAAIRFTAASADPSGFTWKVVAQGSLPSSSDPAPLIGIGLLVVAAAAGAYALALRRRRRGHEGDPSSVAGSAAELGGEPEGPETTRAPERVRS